MVGHVTNTREQLTGGNTETVLFRVNICTQAVRKFDGEVGIAHLEEQLLPRQAVLSDLAVLPAQLFDASPLPVALVENV